MTCSRFPPGLIFADLALEFGDEGELLYQPEPLEAIAALNGRSIDTEDDAMSIVVDWYVTHRETGGAPDPACETIVALLTARGA